MITINVHRLIPLCGTAYRVNVMCGQGFVMSYPWYHYLPMGVKFIVKI